MKGHATTIIYGSIGCVTALAVSFWLERSLGHSGDRSDILAMAQRVSETPKEVPNWKLDSDGRVDKEAVEYLQCETDWRRRYVSLKKNDRISVAVLVGPSGPLSQHDPNTCFPAQGYRTIKEQVREKFKVGNEEITLLTTTMQSGEVGGQKIKVVWGWHDQKQWTAPDYARFKFGWQQRRFLVKLQVVLELDALAGEDASGLENFLNDFLPILDAQIKGSTPPAPPAKT